MPVSFFSLPEHVQNATIHKLEFTDFLNFHRSSRKAYEAAIKVNARITLSGENKMERNPFPPCDYGGRAIGFVHSQIPGKKQLSEEVISVRFGRQLLQERFCQFPVRFQNCNGYAAQTFTEEFCLSLLKFLETAKSSLICFNLDKISCLPSTLCRLIESGRVKELQFIHTISPNYFKMETLKRAIKFCIHGYTPEADVLSLTVDKFTVNCCNVTSEGINFLLKELVRGKRSCETWKIGTDQELHEDVIFNEIPTSLLMSRPEGDILVIDKEKSHTIEFYYGDVVIRRN